MANWLSLNTGSLPIQSSVQGLTDSLEPILTSVAAAAQGAAAVMGGLAAIAGSSVDPLGLVKNDIDDLINSLVESGLYGLVVSPDLFASVDTPRGPDGFLRIIKTAMNDRGDTNRPPFGAGASSSGVMFVMFDEDVQTLGEAAVGFQALFGEAWTDLVNLTTARPVVTPHRVFETTGEVTGVVSGEDPRKNFVDVTQSFYTTPATFDLYNGQLITAMTGQNVGSSTRIESFDNDAKVFRLNPGFRYPLEVGDGYAISYDVQSKPPDWRSYRLVDAVPVTADAVEVLARVRDSMPAYGMSTQFTRLEQILLRKQELFEDLAAQITSLADIFDSLSTVSGVYMLPIPPQSNGNQGFLREAFAATNVPPIGPNDYTIGIVLYGGSGVYDSLGKVFPLP